jgi:hypothetical protein
LPFYVIGGWGNEGGKKEEIVIKYFYIFLNEFELLQATNVWETHSGDALVPLYPYLGVLLLERRNL